MRDRDDTEGLPAGLAAGDRRALARAITVIESSRPDHRAAAGALLAAVLISSKDSKEHAEAAQAGEVEMPAA